MIFGVREEGELGVQRGGRDLAKENMISFFWSSFQILSEQISSKNSSVFWEEIKAIMKVNAKLKMMYM